jgi:hypothetical protein
VAGASHTAARLEQADGEVRLVMAQHGKILKGTQFHLDAGFTNGLRLVVVVLRPGRGARSPDSREQAPRRGRGRQAA